MSMVIANNMQAVNTKRQFAISGRGQSSAMEKLSSGYKINTGKDDPSGLVISEKLRSQLNGLKRAQQNTEEAINVMGIAEGALNEMNAILKKMKALAIHSNNTGVTSPDQINADQAEMDSAIQTLDRIAQTTKFSEDNLLNGAKDIAYDTTTSVKGTQQNSLLDTRETSFKQIFKRDDYAVAISFTGTASADEVTGMGQVDFTKQAAKAYLEVDTSSDPDNQAQISQGKFTQDQQFTLTGTKGSRAFTFNKGETVATMVSQIKSVADSTGIDAALVFNSDQRIHMTTNGATVGVGAVAEDATFTINGVNQAKAADGSVAAVEFKLGKGMAAYMEDKGINSITFTVGRNDAGEYTLSANAGKGDILVTSGWNGQSGTLAGSITAQAAYDPDNAAFMTALAANLTATGNISSATSKLEPTYKFSNQSPAAIDQKVLGNLFGAAAGANDGNVQLDAKVDWNKVYESLSTEADKTAFRIAAEANTLQIGVAVVAGSTQAKTSFDITISDGAPGAAGVTTFRTQRIDMSSANVDELLKTNGTTLTFDSGALAGTTLEVTTKKADLSYIKIGSQAAADVKASEITGGAQLTKQTDAAADAQTDLAADLADSNPVSEAVVFSDLATGPADVTITISTAAGTNGEDSKLGKLLADGKIDGKMDLIVRLNEGQDKTNLDGAGAPSYSLVAKIGGQEVIVNDNWDGKAAAVAHTSGSMESIAGNETVDFELLDAVSELVFTSDAAIDEATVMGAGAVFDKAVVYGDPSGATMDFTATKVADGIYSAAGTAGHGAVSIRMTDVNIDNLLADPKFAGGEFLAAFKAAGDDGKVIASLQNIVDDEGNPTGGFNIHLNFTKNDGTTSVGSTIISSSELGLDNNGETVDSTTGAAGGWHKLTTGILAGMEIQVTNAPNKSAFIGTGAMGANADAAAPATAIGLDATATLPAGLSSAAVSPNPSVTAIGQTGGFAADGSAVRGEGTVAIFNNQTAKNKDGVTTGTVEKGVTGIDISADGAASVQLGKNTDGQGRIFVKFTDDGSFELYKDASMSAESMVATGINGQPITQSNNSGLEGITLNIAGSELTKVNGIYFTMAGIEGLSENQDPITGEPRVGDNGVINNGDVVGKAGVALFDETKTLITGVELGKNTDADGRIYLETVYDHENGTVRVNAYKDRNKTPEDLVAQSDLFDISTFQGLIADGKGAGGSATIVLNEKRNADNTAGTGLGMVLSTADAGFGKLMADEQNVTLASTVEFKNLGARIFAQDYGSANFIKATQDKGNIFSYYAAAGDNDSKRMIDATSGGVTVQVNGQDATLSVNGTQVKTNGLELSMATQDIQADLVFNQGKVGSTTMAQVGYETASIFTKIGALNLGSVEAEESGKYAGLSGLMANAGHVTNERVDNFQGGMQLQLGEGAGDQNRTVVAIKSLTSENLGRVTQGGYWEGNAVYSEKTFTMKDVFGGGAASLKQKPTLAMAIIEQSIADVSELRAQIGAVQTNMLQTNSNNLAVTMENIQKTESGIRDADMADEMTEFTKNQVLQGAAMSMMSQANQSSQNVLQLLR